MGSVAAKPGTTGPLARAATGTIDGLSRAAVGGVLSRLRSGRIEVLEGGRARGFGPEDAELRATVTVNDPAAWRGPLRGSVGLGEGYVDGRWETDDLVTLMRIAARELRELDGWRGAVARPRGIAHRLRRLVPENTRPGARRNIAAHYDLGNAFYGEWLDPSMTYSSAVFESAEDSLETAQRRKYQRLIDQLEISAAHHVLEIGSGWGGFAIQAARQTGCRVTSITLSQAQLVEAQRRAWRAGVADRVTFELMDYRDVSETYDRIVSIEMFEAVGEQYWPTYFEQVHDRLKPGGRAGIQVITIEEQRFEDYRRSADFIQRYIFPGGMLPSPERFLAGAKTAGLEALDVFTFGADYARTLVHWDQAVREKADSLAPMGYDARFQRLWHAYLCYCQVGFETGRIDVMQTVLTRR